MSELKRAQLACNEGWFAPVTLAQLSAGRINDSYHIGTKDLSRGYVLQSINARVFEDAQTLMLQLGRVVAHLNDKQPGWVPTLVPTQTGAQHLLFADRVWRLWQFVPGESLQPELCEPTLLRARLRAAGRAFATTQVLLEDLPGGRLQAGIDHYHDLDYFLRQFDALAGAATAQWRDRIGRYCEQPSALKQHDGYIHGDCKPDNLLFEPDSETIAAVLDLDTVMWGNRALDFGDLVRSSVWQQEAFEPTLFAALLEGFHDGQQGSKQPIDPDQLLHAPVFVSFMLSLRYLIDHLRGNKEFKVQQHGDNLERAERQFQRTVELTNAHAQMQAAIARLY